MEEYVNKAGWAAEGQGNCCLLGAEWPAVKKGLGALPWGQVSLANKDQTSEGTVTLPESQHLPRGLTLAGAV